MLDPKRVEKLNLILDWKANKPSKDRDWAEDVKAESLHVKFDYQLSEMEKSHSDKLPKVQKDLDKFINWPDVVRYELTQQFEQMFKDQGNTEIIEGKTLQQWVDEEFDSQQLYYTWKVNKLEQSIERIKKERELRDTGFVVTNKSDDKSFKNKKDLEKVPEENIRYLLGTTYYIDPVNGTDTFAGTRIDGTIDSSADTTHFVDAALTGADDYILNSYFYNVTTGHGCLISDFTAIDDTVTLASADASMAAGDTYYILNSWLDLDTFTEAARSAGDKCIIRRGANQCDDGTDLTFTSDGTIANPIIIESDYDNLWHDQTDLSSTATATLTFGSKTVTFSADISGALAAGDWIYASGDNNREFAYEVASVVTTTVTLYLPYKGNQAGSGRTIYNMQDNPIWNTAAGDFQVNFDTDEYWKVQGLHFRGTDIAGIVEIDSSKCHQFLDCTFEGNGTSVYGLAFSDDAFLVYVNKCRFLNYTNGISFYAPDIYGWLSVTNCLFNGASAASSYGFAGSSAATQSGNVSIEESEFTGNASADIDGHGGIGSSAEYRNCIFSSATEIGSEVSIVDRISAGFEDYDGVVGDNRYILGNISKNLNAVIYQSETTTVRGGGSNKSIKVTPTTNMTTIWDFNKLMVFELPIYATTDSKTYTVYFRPSATTDWTADPTASELWIELEAWGHATNNFRKITKSTGVIDMNGSTAWQALTVTVAPAQTGVAYLRCWYCKTKEAGSNIFYVDPVPVIS